MTPLLLPVILVSSLLLTMIGLGGGLIFSPLFVLAGMAKAHAAAASLLLNCVATGSAAYVYARKGMVDYALSVPLIFSTAICAPLGAMLNTHIAEGPFLLALAVVLALAGVRMFFGKPPESDQQAPPTRKVAGGLIIGATIGLVGGMLGIGGGTFVVPLLIYVLQVPTRLAAASSTFIVCLGSFTGFLGYASTISPDWSFLIPAAIASIIGGQIGARLMSARLSGKVIRHGFAVLLFILCIAILARLVFA